MNSSVGNNDSLALIALFSNCGLLFIYHALLYVQRIITSKLEPYSLHYHTNLIISVYFPNVDSNELKREARHLESQIAYCMSQLTRQVKRRDRLR